MQKHLLIITLVATLTSSCAFLNKADIEYERNTTLGQELIDLQKARQAGAINKDEFETAKKDLLENF